MDNKPLLPRAARSLGFTGADDGAVIQHAGRYARENVLIAYEMIGGVDRMADWANRNPDLFFTRLFTKVITRELEIGATEGVEDLLMRLDAAERAESGELVQDADYSIIEDDNG